MKRNGLVFVPREPTKRVILYPTQDSTSQQQLQQPNGFSGRAKTALITTSNQHETQPTSNINFRLSRQAPLSSLPNGTTKLAEKSGNEGTIPFGSGQPSSLNGGQKAQNPYHANPFFRPKVVTNQPQSSTAATANTNLPPPASSRDSAIIPMNVTLQTLTSASTTIANRGRPPIAFRAQNPVVLSNGRAQEPEVTADTNPVQEDNRRWAHNVTSAPGGRRLTNDEHPTVTFNSSETNIPNPVNSDTLKPKTTSATDIVISLMDTWRAPINPAGSSAINVFTRAGIARDDSVISSQTLGAREQMPNTPPFLTIGTSSTAINNNQNWKKALVANFQKNSRTNPTAKLFISKQTAVPSQPSTSISNDTTVNQQSKSDRTMILNGLNNERNFQVTENAPSIPSLIRKSTESLRLSKQENNVNNNIERATSLQIQSATYTNPAAPSTTANKTEETAKTIEVVNPEAPSHMAMPIPPALITAKPPANVETQRAIITRVMIRRDFVKSTESKPAMPIAPNFRSFIPPQSAKPGGLPANSISQATTVAENNNVPNSTVLSNRMYPFQQSQPQHQQSIPLSQKSLLSYTSTNSTIKDSLKTENNQQQSNSVTNDSLTSSSIMKMQQASTVATNGASIRSTSLSAANAESRRKREELINKLKKRATSASAIPNDGMLDKDPFEVEDEEYEAELEEESVRSSESDVETDNAFSLDPASLLSDKVRRVGNTEVKSGFIPSLFHNVPPTIRFCTENQRLEQLPLPLRKMMKWKMSSITPNIVKNTVIRSGFRLISVDEGSDWLGTWSRHMKPICFKAIREYQKVNHFPGSFQIGRKDRLWRNLSHMQAVHSRREFDFVPQTFVLPADFLLFKRVFDEIADTKESKWIIKPPASARGQGIRVISKMEHVPKKRPVIVQKYIANPYLINGHKFDLRLYVYVTSHDPLRIYLFDDGLARFASRKYSAAVKSLSDRFMHLTNYSINRYNSEYRTNNDSAACTGHKWSLKALWTYLKKRDVDVADIMERIKDLIIKTIISADSYVNVLTKANVRRKFCVHELFGFDVILDEQCKPYIVEVNISPSLHSNSPLDISVKGAMISDLLNLSGFMIPDRRDILYEGSARRKPKLPKSLIFDRRILPQSLSTDEKVKHQHFAQRYHDEQARRNILDVLTPDDLRILIETEDEFSRRGSFERIFPTNQTRKYLKYFETPRYYNLILNEWIAKYNRLEERGIALLNTFCKKGIHLQHPAVDTNHMWTQYQKLQGHLSHREHDNNNNHGS